MPHPDPHSLGWAIVGPGRIAHRLAEAVQRLPGTHLAVVQGRELERARAFADAWQRADAPPVHATTGLAEALARPDVGAVYVATPHAFHAGAVRAALQAGKAVLCEKPLVPSRAQAEPLVALARERGVFLMEALWTRLLPLYDRLGRALAAGRIGALRGLQSSFCFPAPFDAASRLFDPALAGGALLDIGIYNLAVTRWALHAALGHCPEPVAWQVSGRLAPTGVDQRVWAMLEFPGGIVSQFTCALDGAADNGLRIQGAHGHVNVPHHFWEATAATLHAEGAEGGASEALHAPFDINGFEYEVREVLRGVREGRVESPLLPHAETLATLGWLDTLRARLGVRYPFVAADNYLERSATTIVSG